MSDRVELAKAEAQASRRRLIATLGELQHRLSPRNMVGEAVSALKDNGASLVKGSVAAIKRKPMEAVASLIGFIGPVSKWLDDRGRQFEHIGGSIMTTVQDNTLNRNSSDTDLGTDSQAGKTSGGSSGRLSDVAGTAAAKARDARGYAQDKLAGARVAASATYSSAVEKGSELAQTARVKASQVAQQVEEQVQTTPLSIVVGGIALGTLLGLVLPRTRREAELLGDAGRRVTNVAREAVQSAKDAGQERLDQLGATGEVALKVAKLVGEKSGLTTAADNNGKRDVAGTDQGASGKSGRKARAKA